MSAFSVQVVAPVAVALALAAAHLTPAAVVQSPVNSSPPVPLDTERGQPPRNATSAAPVDPAAAIFSTSAGLLMVTVRGDRVGDYEAVIRALQQGLATATDDRLRAIGKGWRVFKATTGSDPKANAVFVHLIDPVVPDVDYRPSLLLDELLAGASAEMLGKYRDAIVGSPGKLGMEEFADLGVPPPANASPPAPGTPKKPGR